MNEKELRERKTFLDWAEQHEDFGLSYKQIADYWLARIHERDQRLKEKILSLPAATRSECETENVLCANDIINLIDNHDQPRPEE